MGAADQRADGAAAPRGGLALLDSLEAGPTRDRLAAALAPAVHHHLREERFAPCVGCFECWTTHPGTCKAKDAANEVMADLVAADEVIWAFSPRFGCVDAATKFALDKVIGVVLPFFTTIEGETHHQARYAAAPTLGLLAVSAAPLPDAERARLAQLAARNALNLHHQRSWVAVVHPDDSPAQLRAAVDAARAAPHAGAAPLPRFCPPPAAGPPGRRALLIVASAKPRGTSTSEALGRALLGPLEARGWSVEIGHLSAWVKRGRAEAPALADAVAAADLIVFATPVYADSLPALALAALDALGPEASGKALLPIVQCGFPELSHTTLALEVLAAAAAAHGMRWAGHLAVGGGGALSAGALAAGSGPAHHAAAGIALAVQALDQGQPVPPEASAAFATPAMPAGLYRLAGDLGWLRAALQHGALLDLWDRPLAPTR